MPFDTLIKKFFPGIVAVLVAVIAYLQASGVVQLATSSALAPNPEDMASGSLLRTPTAGGVGAQRTRSANKLFEHNVFDPDTELLRTLPEPEPEPGEEGDAVGVGKLDLSDPLSAKECDDVGVNIVTESDDPTWSIAVLQAPGEDRPALRRVGDKAGDFEVAYIGFNRVEASPAVWLINGTDLCQALLFTDDEKKVPKSKPAPPKQEKKEEPAKTTPRRGAPTVPKEISEKIEKVSANEYNVDRAVVDNILENQAELMRSARIVPEKGADGKTVGIRLFGIRPDTLLGTLGLQNGDRIETINGFNMASPEDALNAYARLRTANKLSVTLTRRGKPTTVDLNIK